MITQNTVLILGAGASRDYGLPTGVGLISEIYNYCGKGKSEIIDFLKRNNYTEQNAEFQLNAFKENLFYGSPASIDDFLASTMGKEFELIGKFCIAKIISNNEQHENLYHEERNDKGVILKKKWYSTLWKSMYEGARKYEHLLQNRISVITFNYDRTLEFFLGKAIMAMFPNHEHKETSKINLKDIIPIYHVYGDIGTLPFLSYKDNIDENTAFSNNDINSNSSLNKINRIKIYHEKNESDELEQKKLDLDRCERIYFLGFGYHQQNLDLLKVSIQRKLIIGTGLDLSPAEREKIKHKVRACFGGKSDPHIYPNNIDELLKIHPFT